MNRTLRHIALCMLLLYARAYTLKAQCPAATTLTLNTITTTESRCQSTGTATVAVSGGATPYTYTITSGPTSLSAQSSNVLKSLSPGSYTVKVTDNCGTSVTGSFTIAGTYAVPVLTVTPVMPSCPGSSDGSISVSATSGRAPLTYALVSPSPVIVGPQAGALFSALPAGTYTLQATDSCGNIQTQTVILAAAPSTVTFNNHGTSLHYVACDSFDVYLSVTISNYKPPYTITETLPNGTVLTQVLTAPAVSGVNFIDTVPIHYHHIAGDTDVMAITITNQCGISVTDSYTLSADFDMAAVATLSSSYCAGYSYTFETSTAYQLHCSTVTYTLVSPSGVVLATKTNSSAFIGYPPGSGYKVIRTDCCRTDTLTFDWDSSPALKITYTLPIAYADCKEGTTSIYMTFNYASPIDIVMASGPPSVTLAGGTVYTYTYPDTIKNVSSYAIAAYFGPGTYKIYAIDPVCGEKDSVTITLGSGDVRHSTFSASLEKGCPGANKILLNVVNNQWWMPGTVTVNSTTANVYSQYDESAATSYSDSVQNLSSGTYYASYQYSDIYPMNYFPDMSTWGCDVIYDTIVVPPYTNPSFSDSPSIVVCGGLRAVALLPDSANGISPYEYQITAGPKTTALQTSAVFLPLTAGTYTFRMVDACNNSYSSNITIDTLAVPSVATTGITCVGADATFALPASPYYSYTWKLPNGSTSTGNTLTLDPITSSDIGTYTVTLTSSIAGCINTTSSTYQLNSCQVLRETLLHFSGQWKNGNIQLSWQTTDEINMNYYIVERSTDGSVFTPVQQVTAIGGTTNTYTATDTHVPTGVVYYRIETVAQNGAIDYSKVISFNSSNVQPFSVYPSQIKGNTHLTAICPMTSHASSIRVISADGKICQTVAIVPGTTQTSIDVTSLVSGVYFVVFTGDGNVMSAQVWKN